MSIVHLFPNEPKFFRGAVSFFRPLNWSEEWVIRCHENSLSVFQSLAPGCNICQFSDSFNLSTGIRGVIVHYLDFEMAKWILELPPSVPVYIQTWGGDTAPLLDSSLLYGPYTRGYYYEKSVLRRIPIQIGYPLYEKRRKKSNREWHQTLRKAIDRAEFTSFLLGTTERNAIAPHLDTSEEFRIAYTENNVAADLHEGSQYNVLLGNSATPTNQHLEALLTLKESKRDFNSILLPLSYGDKQYADWISIKAKHLFGTTVTCLNTFLPLGEYLEQINQCGLIIMNHTRQQALSNIFWALNSGKRLFLNPNGLNYQELRKQGVFCEPLNADQLKATPKESSEIIASVQPIWKTDFDTSTEDRKAFFSGLFT